jgi:Zn-dependent alcohol dehydrogenase
MPTATAAVLSAHHAPFVLEEVQVERPQPGEVLVGIVATGLCHTDLSAREAGGRRRRRRNGRQADAEDAASRWWLT